MGLITYNVSLLYNILNFKIEAKVKQENDICTKCIGSHACVVPPLSQTYLL